MEAACPFKTLVPFYKSTSVTFQNIRILNKDDEINTICLYLRPWACFLQCEFCHLPRLPHFAEL
jgi:hypothetical protein